MKKAMLIIFSALLFIPFISIKADEKLKVYVFEAGDCPYCEAELEYLKTVKSYDEEFEVIRKELYVDHVDWVPGKDYDLGVEVATTFYDAGFEDATYEATPLVVISDLYAAAGYNTKLDDVIQKAIEEGDKDAVSCIERGEENCVRKLSDNSSISTSVSKTNGSSSGSVISAAIMVAALIGVMILSKTKNK